MDLLKINGEAVGLPENADRFLCLYMVDERWSYLYTNDNLPWFESEDAAIHALNSFCNSLQIKAQKAVLIKAKLPIKELMQ